MWIAPLINENSPIKNDPFDKFLISSKRKGKSIETYHKKDSVKKLFTHFTNLKKIMSYRIFSCKKQCSLKGSKELLEIFQESVVFEKVNANWWKDGIIRVANQYKNTKHFETEIIPLHAALKKNEGYVY